VEEGEMGSCAFLVIGLVYAGDVGDSGKVSRGEIGSGSRVCLGFGC